MRVGDYRMKKAKVH
jgi:hypothetical protein